MKTLMLTFGIAGSTDASGRYDDGAARRDGAFEAAFSLGQAWHGGQQAVFVRTAKPLDEVHDRVLEALDDRDLLLVVELPDSVVVRFAGLTFDEEGFREIFPAAIEVAHRNRWTG